MAAQERSPVEGAGTITLGGDLTVRRIGFGSMRITGPGIWGPPRDPDEAERVLRRAVEAGVNLIDTADAYGPDVSEELIAAALHPYPSDLVIATKGGLVRPGPGSWRPDGRPEHLREACDGSLRRLRLDRIDLYQLHRLDPAVPPEDSIGTLVELQKAGKIRHIGVSNVTVAELQRLQAVARIVSVQDLFNLEDRSNEDVLDECARSGLAFIPWRPLSTPAGWGTGVAQRHGVAPRQVALAWMLQRSPVMLPIPGTSTVAHLEENLAAAQIALADDDLVNLAT